MASPGALLPGIEPNPGPSIVAIRKPCWPRLFAAPWPPNLSARSWWPYGNCTAHDRFVAAVPAPHNGAWSPAAVLLDRRSRPRQAAVVLVLLVASHGGVNSAALVAAKTDSAFTVALEVVVWPLPC